MRAPSLLLVCTLLLANTSAGRSPAAEHAEPIYAWLDSLGYPGIKNGPFIRIATGRWWRRSDESEQNDYDYGLLLDDDLDTFRAFSLDTLDTETFVKTPTATEESKRVGFERLDLAARIDTRIEEYFEAMRHDPENMPRRNGRRQLSDRTEFVILSWIASRRGLEARAARLFKLAAEQMDDRALSLQENKPLLPEIADELAMAELRAATHAFGDLRIGRSELLRRFERLLVNFPTSDVPEAKQAAEMLRRMVREDREHAGRRDDLPLEARPRRQQIAEWIFRLRDQDDYGVHGGRRVEGERNEPSPASRLVAFGLDAVPQLIEVIDDERFTRVLYPQRFNSDAFDVLTIGDIVDRILEEIAGRRFDLPPPKPGADLSPAERTVARKELVRAWHDEFLRRGEKQSLIDAVEPDEENALAFAERLAEKYPADAAGPILAFLRRTHDRYRRDAMIELLADLPGEEIEPFLLAELDKPGWLGNYVTAARILNYRERTEAVPAMIRRWKQAAETPDPPASRDFVDDFESQIADFLVTSGRTTAVRAVMLEMNRFNVDIRMNIVRACRKSPSVAGRPDPDPDYEAARIELLIRALDDDVGRSPVDIQWNGRSFESLRVCDLAGHLLRLRDPQKYPFDLGDDLPRRDQDRRAIIVAWHLEKGLPIPPAHRPSGATQVSPD